MAIPRGTGPTTCPPMATPLLPAAPPVGRGTGVAPARSRGPWDTATFVAVELALLAAAHLWGGPAWMVPAVIACVAQVAADFRTLSLTALLPSLGWLAASRLTGNRELYFPFAMYLAGAVAVLPWRGGLRPAAGWGGAVVAAFLVVRVLQGATLRVLAVETAAAVVVLGLALAARRAGGTVTGRAAVAAAASLLAYACLAL